MNGCRRVWREVQTSRWPDPSSSGTASAKPYVGKDSYIPSDVSRASSAISLWPYQLTMFVLNTSSIFDRYCGAGYSDPKRTPNNFERSATLASGSFDISDA